LNEPLFWPILNKCVSISPVFQQSGCGNAGKQDFSFEPDAMRGPEKAVIFSQKRMICYPYARSGTFHRRPGVDP